MNKILLSTLLPIFLLSTTACEFKPYSTLPNLDTTDILEGTDADANGIRDDVDSYIRSTYPDNLARQAISQYAKTLQATFFVDKTDNLAIAELHRAQTRAKLCVNKRVANQQAVNPDNTTIIKVITNATFNTSQRQRHYNNLTNTLSQGEPSVGDSNVCND